MNILGGGQAFRSSASLLNRARGRANGTSGSAIMQEFAKDAGLYADSLAYPEAHLAVKVPDGNLEPSCIIHPEFEVTSGTITGADGYYYVGVTIYDLPSSTVAYRNISAVAADGTITWADQAHPNASLIQSNFQNFRMVSESAQFFDTMSALDRNGEFACARVFDLSAWSSGGFAPPKWSTLVATPGCATCPNTPENEGIRLTWMPPDADNQAFKLTTSSTVTGSALVMIWRSNTANSIAPIIRIFQNMEVVPFMDKSLIFDVSSDLGSPDALNRAFYDVARMLSSMSTTIGAFKSFMSSPTGQSLLSAGGKMFNFFAGLLGYTSVDVRRGRVAAELQVILENLRPGDLSDDECAFLQRTRSRLLAAGIDPLVLRWEQVPPPDAEERKATNLGSRPPIGRLVSRS